MTRKSIAVAAALLLTGAIYCSVSGEGRSDAGPAAGSLILNPSTEDLRTRTRTVYLRVDGMC
ncbi:MAG: hypothetical protein HKN82_01480 [Akkermansiaceae bacterium]|nr:hypothetical protein [Akkermansiaceae bacterium]